VVSRAQTVIQVARFEMGKRTSDNGCASEVSLIFKQAGAASAFKQSSSVKTIVSSFKAADISTSIGTAELADLIVFGDDEHVMVYSGNGLVIGTWTHPNAATIVGEVSATSVVTDNHRTPPTISKILHTHLTGVADPDNKTIVAANDHTAVWDAAASTVGDAVGGMFGTMFAWVPSFAVNAGIVVVAGALVVAGAKGLLEQAA
jgi:hypothetical protein